MQKPWEIAETIYTDEAALLAGLRRGDRLACTCLLKQYMPRLYQVALQLTGHADEAEDVVQESFIAACTQIDRFEGRSRLGSWLHRIVLNIALMRLRRHRATVSLAPTDDPEAAPLELADPGPGPSAQLLSHELLGQIEQAVLALPDSLRAAVVLRDLEGLSTEEAATALGIGESALKVRLHRGRLALRAALAPYLETPHPAGEPR